MYPSCFDRNQGWDKMVMYFVRDIKFRNIRGMNAGMCVMCVSYRLFSERVKR